MHKVLINAYACNPDWGSEQGVGWHWSVELAKYCKVIVITEGEFKGNIERAMADLPQKDNLTFIYRIYGSACHLVFSTGSKAHHKNFFHTFTYLYSE